jgi:hypothetical protein
MASVSIHTGDRRCVAGQHGTVLRLATLNLNTFTFSAGKRFDVAAHASAVVKLCYPANVGKVWKALHSENDALHP